MPRRGKKSAVGTVKTVKINVPTATGTWSPEQDEKGKSVGSQTFPTDTTPE